MQGRRAQLIQQGHREFGFPLLKTNQPTIPLNYFLPLSPFQGKRAIERELKSEKVLSK